MKKNILISIVIGILLVSTVAVLSACGKPDDPKNEYDPFDDPSVTYDARQWVSGELYFTSDKEYEDPVYNVSMDCVFTNTTTGTTYTVPAFWNGGTDWIVRYALTEKGDWTWKTTCSDADNTGLMNKEGALKCGAYKGDLEIYKHGFIKTEPGKHYFMYADGTPFFYIGDTHWTLPLEKYEGYSGISDELANQYGVQSMFKFIMDYRAEQGFTVIQSQPLGTYVGITGNSWFGDARGDIFTYGVNDLILEKFKTYDKYFQYIADKGFVHSNAQFAYPEELIEVWGSKTSKLDEAKLESLCRYWVARYSAYPVMWATSQEGDDDYYGYNGCTAENNPWKLVFEYTQKYDPYDHPASCHQENVGNTRVANSAFAGLDGYTWYAMQYSVGTGSGSNQNFECLKQYYNNPGSKPVVNYEGCYDNYWIGPRGARSQGWCAYLNGVFGHGYGSQPVWSLFWGGGDTTNCNSGGEEYSRDKNWIEGLTSSGGFAMSYMKKFFEEYEWWKLEPCFDGNEYYSILAESTEATNYSFATIENELYIGYLYNNRMYGTIFGKLTGMKKGNYEIKWFNPRTGEYLEDEEYSKKVKITDGEYIIDGKPDQEDWVIVAKYVK